MTGCAILYARRRQVVEAGRVGRPGLVKVAVAFDAKLRNVIALEQFGITRAVRVVAACAAFDLRRRVFKHERPLLVCVALEAGRIRAYGKPRLFLLEPAVRVVAVRTLHRAFENLVMEWLCELRFRFVVAGHAQLRLVLEQHLWRREIVRGRRERAERLNDGTSLRVNRKPRDRFRFLVEKCGEWQSVQPTSLRQCSPRR